MTDQMQKTSFDRYLSPLDAWAMGFGVAVGWGAFVMPGTTFLPLAGPGGTVIAMGISVAIMLVIAYNFAFLMRRSSRTGGVYSYAKEAFGRDHAFLCSWFLCLSYLTIVFLNGTALFLVIRTIFGESLQGGPHYTVAGNEVTLAEVGVSVLVLAVIGALSAAAKPVMQRLHTVLAMIMILGTLAMAICCLPAALTGDWFHSVGTLGLRPGVGILNIVILAPWAFVGFEVISFDTAHFRFPMRKSKGIVFTCIITAGLMYIAIALVAIGTAPDGYDSWMAYLADLDNCSGVASVPTFYVANAIMGRAGLAVMGITALAAILTGIIGGYRATTRILSSMAEDRILSEKFSKTTYSILFIMALSILISLLGRNTLTWFVDLTSLGAIVGFGYTSAAAWKIARMENYGRAVITGRIGTLISEVFVVVQLVPWLTALEAMEAEAFLLLSLWCLLGFVFYWRTVIHSTLSEYSGISTSGIALFSLLVYASILWVAKHLMACATVEEVRASMLREGLVMLAIIFIGLVIMLYVQDLVHRKHELSEREKIRAVEGSLAKSQFLFNMSHDIRTPMNAIIGYTKLVMEETEDPEVRSYMEKIDNSSQHLLSLINDILEMSRIESGKVTIEQAPEDLRAIFSGMENLFREQMKEKGLDFSVHTTQIRDPYIWCDRKNLNRVLLNILSNAFKFTPEGGTVTLAAYETGSPEDGYASYEIRVQDSGIGMSADFVERMFNAFERERTSTVSGIEGTGLGLSITKNLVDMMGGTIEVLTSPGSGTEFIIRLTFRLAKESDLPRQSPVKPAAAATADFSGRRVLLVEDNMVNLEIAKMILENKGFLVDTAENGREAVDRVAEMSADTYDIILMDIQMPVMDGYEATKAIRAMTDPAKSKLPIVAMTANAFAEDVQAAADSGMQGHIAKPVDIDMMVETLAGVLGKK